MRAFKPSEAFRKISRHGRRGEWCTPYSSKLNMKPLPPPPRPPKSHEPMRMTARMLIADDSPPPRYSQLCATHKVSHGCLKLHCDCVTQGFGLYGSSESHFANPALLFGTAVMILAATGGHGNSPFNIYKWCEN